MGHSNVNLQDSFLNQVRKESAIVEILLTEGSKLEGLVRGFDNFTVMVHVDGKQHMVYKHAIAQMIAPQPQRSEPKNNQQQKSDSKGGEGERNDKKSAERREEKFNAMDFSGLNLEITTVDEDNAPVEETKE